MAEQFAFHQFRRDGATVDGDKGGVGAGALQVDLPGDQLLAGSRRPFDEDRCLAAREFLDRLLEFAHLRGIADDAVVVVGPGAVGETAVGAVLGRQGHAGGLQTVLDQRAKLFQRHRLGHEVVGAGLHRLDSQFHAAMGGNHGNRQLRLVLLDVLDQGDAVAVGEAHVGKAEIEIALLDQPRGAAVIGGACHLQTHAQQGHFQQFADVGFVVNDEYGLFAHLLTSCLHRVKRAPPSG